MFYFEPKNRIVAGHNEISYWGQDSVTHQLARITTYGGKLAENVVQATARDLLASALIAVNREFKVALHVHDEIVCSIPDEQCTEEVKQKLNELVSEVPEWAIGLPNKAEGEFSNYYCK